MSELERKKVEDEILQAVRDVQYGSVEIIIHNKEVVQIERKTKVRFNLKDQSETR